MISDQILHSSSDPQPNALDFSDPKPNNTRFETDLDRASGPPALWSEILQNGRVKWDPKRIRCVLDSDSRADNLFLRNVLRGHIITGRMYPLLFRDPEAKRSRSIEFFKKLTDCQSDLGKEQARLSQKENVQLGLCIRDLFLASFLGILDQTERELKQLASRLAPSNYATPVAAIHELTVSFFPSSRFPCLRFVDTKQLIDAEEGLFAIFPVGKEEERAAVFVDPRQLSYHNFENILPLDAFVKARDDAFQFDLEETTSQWWSHTKSFRLSGSTQCLNQVAALDLYTEPSNLESRGGRRFIFHSSSIADALSRAIRRLDMSEWKGLSSADKFVSVNSVFRCNLFRPGDKVFQSHLDTPFRDANRSHYSLYTMLIYLKETRSGSLEVFPPDDEDEERENIDLDEAMMCVLFPQKCRHIGFPCDETDKIFFRTELIFESRVECRANPLAMVDFAKAVYVDGMRYFSPEAGAAAAGLYDSSNRGRWDQCHLGLDGANSYEIFFLKGPMPGQEHGFPAFVTNGHEYWFPVGCDLREAAVVAIMDYCNCHWGGSSFRSLCRCKVIDRPTSEDKIYQMLHFLRSSVRERLINFCTTAEKEFAVDQKIESQVSESKVPVNSCCWLHDDTQFAWADCHEFFEVCASHFRSKVMGAPIVFLGQKDVLICEDDIRVMGDKIYISSPSIDGKAREPIFFAACGRADPLHFVTSKESVEFVNLLVPPIPFEETSRGIRLCIDIFRNDWMTSIGPTKRAHLPFFDNDVHLQSYLEIVDPGVKEEVQVPHKRSVSFARNHLERLSMS